MKSLLRNGLATLSLTATLASAVAAGPSPEKPPHELAKPLNGFALELLKRVGKPGENAFISPYSIHSALTMTAMGAAGRTAEQMLETLGWAGAEGLDPHAHSGAALRWLNARAGKRLELSIANAAWVQKDWPLKSAFKRTVTNQYGAKAANVDYKRNAPQARKTINRWVAERTAGKIEDLIPEGELNRRTRLVLTNAIYFKGSWKHPFDEEKTKKRPFTLASGEEVKAPLMRQTAKFRYADFDGGKALQLPYADGPLEMVVLLPERPAGLAALEKRLSAEKLDEWLSDGTKREVRLSLPKFEVTFKEKLKNPLKAMGMRLAFDRQRADLSEISSRKEQLYIDQVFHQAYVAVDEAGTEAAGATGVEISAVSLPPAFKADHPFVYLIRDRESGSILFAGRMLDPR